MKYMVLQEGEMVSQIKQRILAAEKEHFSLNLQFPEMEKDLKTNARKLLSFLLRMRKLEASIELEKQKLSTLDGI